MTSQQVLQRRDGVHWTVIESSASELKEAGFTLFDINSCTLNGNQKKIVSLRKWMTPVKNQLSLGTCTCFGTIATFEFCVANGIGSGPKDRTIDLSESHLSHVTETLYGNCLPDLSTSSAIKVLIENGVTLTRFWEYDDQNVCSPNPPNLSGKPLYYWNYGPETSGTYLQREMNTAMQNGDDIFPLSPPDWTMMIHDCILRKRTAMVEIPVFLGGWGWDYPSNGLIKIPTAAAISEWFQNKAEIHSWHLITIVGFDDASQLFSFKNSWGEGWGDRGYGKLPFDYVTKYARLAITSYKGFSIGTATTTNSVK